MDKRELIKDENREEKKNIIMMKKRHILHWAMGVVMTPLLGSCAFDELHEIAGGGDNVLSFEVGVEQLHDSQGWTRASGPQMRPMHSLELVSAQGDTIYARSQSLGIINEHSNVSPATRAAAKTTNKFYDSFGVIAFNYANTSSWDDVKSDATPLVYNAKASQSQSGGKWVVGSGNYWPGASKKVSFFAYAPHNENNSDIFLSNNTATGAPKITYTVPSAAANQSDLLVATAIDKDGSGTSSPALTFSHALCGVKFAVGSMEGITNITKIIISGVYNKGTLEIGGSAWTIDNSSANGNYEITMDQDVSTITNHDITSGDDLLFLMPQEVPSGATLTITADGKEYSTTIAGESWAMGAMVTYKLSINKITGKYEFNVTSTDVAQDAITADITVTSYFEYNDGNSSIQKAIKWNVETYGATISSIGGSDTDISRTVTLSFSANNETSSQDATLQAKAEVGTENDPVDLSIRTKNSTQVRETANCYVVNAPGWYMFPLVYGNGIKSSTTNYDNNLTGFKDKGTVFTTHEETKKMSELSSPWIYDNYSSETMSADLVWQDADKLIYYNSYQIVDVNSKKYMKFHISKSNIKQGNAVLAVKNSSQILWSWHIWVTALDVYSTQTVTSTYNNTTQTFNFMPVPLGWYSASKTVNPKTYTFSVKQEGSGKTANGTVTQAGQTGPASGTCTFYQWGRKDPFPPSDSPSLNSTTDKTLYAYDTSGKSTTKSWSPSNSQVNIATSILNPSTFYFGYANWCSQKSDELWNVGEDDYYVDFETITKSVYDPSPAGFRLPETAAFTGFTTNGENTGTPNGTWNDTTKGYTFTNGVETYWQACGWRAYDSGSLDKVGSDGYYWSAGPSKPANGRNLTFLSRGYVNPQNNNYRAYGFPVRPVSE